MLPEIDAESGSPAFKRVRVPVHVRGGDQSVACGLALNH